MERRTFIWRLLLAPLAVLGFLNMKSSAPRGVVTVSGGKLTPESKERVYKWVSNGVEVEYGLPLVVYKTRPRGVPG